MSSPCTHTEDLQEIFHQAMKHKQFSTALRAKTLLMKQDKQENTRDISCVSQWDTLDLSQLKILIEKIEASLPDDPLPHTLEHLPLS